jgi:RNA polymerase sigma-70 factor (ECF subfamily)
VAQGASFEGLGFGLDRGDLSDSQLLLAAQQGDAAAFQELVLSYEAMVLRVALALTGSENAAQDLYCNVFRDAFASVSKLDASTSVFVWLHRVLVRHCLAFCRRQQRYAQGCQASDASPSLAGILRCLPPTERVILVLRQSEGLKVRTLAEILACSQEHIVEVLQRGTHRLRTQVALGARRIA